MKSQYSLAIFTKSIVDLAPEIRALENDGYLLQTYFDLGFLKHIVVNEVPDLIIIDPTFSKPETIQYLTEVYKVVHPEFNPICILGPSFSSTLEEKYSHIEKRETINEFIRDIRNILRKKNTASVPVHSRFISVTLPVQIRSVNEGGMLIETSSLIKNGSLVSLSSQKLNHLFPKECIFKKTNSPSQLSEANQFLNDIVVVGITPESAQKIRLEKYDPKKQNPRTG